VISPGRTEADVLRAPALQYLTPLVAVSLVALTVYVYLKVGGGAEPFYRTVIGAGAAAVGVVAVTVFYSLLFEDVTLFILLISSALLVVSGVAGLAFAKE
jgi:positive regulator of sigma E activity